MERKNKKQKPEEKKETLLPASNNQENTSYDGDISDAEIQRKVDDYNIKLSEGKEPLTVEGYKELVKKLNERFSSFEYEEQEMKYDLTPYFEVNIRNITTLEMFNFYRLPEGSSIADVQYVNFLKIEKVQLPVDYTNTVLPLLMFKKLYRTQEEIINELTNEGHRIVVTIQDFFEANKQVFIPIKNSVFLNNPYIKDCYYSFRENYNVKPTDYNHSKLFAYLLRNTELDNIDALLNYQLERHFDQSTYNFFRFLENCITINEWLLNEKTIEIIKGWIKWKEKAEQSELFFNEAIGHARKKDIPDSTHAQQILAFYFLFKFAGINPAQVVPALAKLIHFLTGRKFTSLQNSETYSKLLKMPCYNKGETLIDDLTQIRSYFMGLKTPTLLEMIDQEITKAIDGLPNITKRKYTNGI